ncbi:MAG TPA: IclR family transcriptional regulator [Candidatus Cybelea sp.]|nr:IclR family transcriptional regulator [Candidatus Cybelea sp.]
MDQRVRSLDERYRVQSLGRALDLLELIATRGKEGARLTDLARELGLSKAAVYALLQTLLNRGFLSDMTEGANRRYRLGLALARLGDMAVANIALTDVAMPELRRLTAELGMTSRLAILDEGFAVVVGRVDAPGSIRFDAALGRREMPHCSAVGKALLSALPQEEALRILAQTSLPRRTPRTITAIPLLMKELAATQERGYAIDDEEDTEGVACIGSCIFNRSGHAAGAISITGLKPRDWRSRIGELAARLRQCAGSVSRQLGYSEALDA